MWDQFYEPTSGRTFTTVGDFRLAHPHTSFGDLDTEDERNAFGLYRVLGVMPEHDPRTQVLTEIEPVVIDGLLHRQWRIDPAPVEHVIAAVQQAVQQRLDDFARTRNYDSILSAATYATSAVAKFAAEGQYAVQARDASWAACYQVMADVQSGTRPMPSVEQVLAELPVLVWP